MNERSHKDDLIRKKLSNFEKTPPPEVWDGIRDSLASPKRRIVPLFLPYAAGIIILLGIAALIKEMLPSEDNIILSSQKNGEPTPVVIETPESNLFSESTDKEIITNSEKATPPSVASHYQPDIHELPESVEVVQSPSTERNSLVNDKEQEMTAERSDILASASTAGFSLPVQVSPFTPDNPLLIRTQNTRKYSWDDINPMDQIENEEKKKNIFSLGAQVSPIYSYRDISGVSSSLNEFFNESESGKISYSGGLNIGIQASKRISIHSGVIYNRLGISVNNILAVAEYKEAYTDENRFEPNASSPFLVSNSIGSIQSDMASEKSSMDYSTVSPASPSSILSTELNYLNAGGFYAPADNYVEDGGSIDQLFHYLEIPLLIRYKIVDRQMDFGLLGGLSSNFLVGSRVVYHDNGGAERIGSTQDIQSINYSGNLGIGLNYDFTPHFRFLFEPQVKYYLNSINNDDLIINRPYAVGLYTGFVYLF